MGHLRLSLRYQLVAAATYLRPISLRLRLETIRSAGEDLFVAGITRPQAILFHLLPSVACLFVCA